MAKTEMPSADLLLAEVLQEKCFGLEHKMAEGLTRDIGILHMNGIPFVWDLQWETKQKVTKFHLEVFHVRPKTLKLVASRYFDNTTIEE